MRAAPPLGTAHDLASLDQNAADWRLCCALTMPQWQLGLILLVRRTSPATGSRLASHSHTQMILTQCAVCATDLGLTLDAKRRTDASAKKGRRRFRRHTPSTQCCTPSLLCAMAWSFHALSRSEGLCELLLM